MKAISKQLGEQDTEQEAYDYVDRICSLGLSEEVTEKLARKLKSFCKCRQNSQEARLLLEIIWIPALTCRGKQQQRIKSI